MSLANTSILYAEQLTAASHVLLDSMGIGAYHPQLLFATAYMEMCRRFDRYQIIVWWSFALQVIFYFALSFPSFVFDFIPAMQKYKVQPKKHYSLADQWRVLRKVLFTKVSMILPTAIIGYYLLEKFHYNLPYEYETMPAWYTMLARIYVSLWIEDTWHYFFHRAFHHPSIYGLVHKVHHTFTAPFAFAAEYAHPVETFMLAIGFFLPLVLFFDHLWFFWAWLFVRMAETADVHSGYDAWFLRLANPLHLLPFYGGVTFHDFHHERFTSCYASTFTLWDRLFGTDADYRKAMAERKLKAKEAAAKKFM